MKITLSEVKAGYAGIKKMAIEEYKKGNYEKSLEYIDKAATIASQIMWRYADDELEELLAKISTSIIGDKGEISNSQKKKAVFYDYFGSTFILAIQYVKALTNNDYEVLYVYEEREWDLNVSVIEIMEKIPNVSVKIISNKYTRLQRIQEIYNTIVSFNPGKLFIHINTLSHCIPALYSLPESIKRYYINLGDHAYWLGTRGIDYSFEFRSFGATVTYQKRGLKKEQLLLLPYYPIINGFDFQGFPKQCENKVVIYSGGDFYKMVDAENTYWSLVKNVLDQNPEAVIVFSNKVSNSKGQEFLDSFVKDNNFEGRFLPIGFRADINEVFKNCDIFLGTCPMSGGLMSQYAAFNSKPVLQYYPKELFAFEETESMICFNKKMSISFTDKKKFLSEARHLIADKQYRLERGEELKSCMISEKQFNELFKKSLTSNTTQVEIDYLNVNYRELEKWWLEVNNGGFSDVGSFICGVLGKKKLANIPTLYLKYLLKRIKKKMSR